MLRAFRSAALSVALCCAGFLAVSAQEGKKAEIAGGIEGKVKAVDVDAGKLTVTTTDGRDRTFTITDDTTMVGPRGGIVRRRLKDPRFHPGLAITVVASGGNATELHLGIDRHSSDDTPATKKESTRDGTKGSPPESKQAKSRPATGAATKTETRSTQKSAPNDDDDEHFPGKVKSADPSKRILVVTLLNGTDRSYMVSRDAKVLIRGTASKQGLADPALKAGAVITVVTEPGGRKVKELKVTPVTARAKQDR